MDTKHGVTADDDVPPLEDMSELVEQLNTLHEMKQTLSNDNGHTERIPSPVTKEALGEIPSCQTLSNKAELQNESNKSSKKKTSSKSDNFGGFQKGFLFASKSSVSSSSKQKAVKSCKPENGENNIPMIRPKHPNDSKKKHEIPEVQEAMKSSIPLLDSKDWITGDLLKKIEQNPMLAKYLMDPRFSQALMRIQSDPKAAWELLEGNAELQKVLKDFCGLMGDHLTKLGDGISSKTEKVADEGIGLVEKSTFPSQMPSNTSSLSSLTSSQPSKDDEAAMNKILDNGETREALSDPEIQKLINCLKFNPDAAQMQLRSASPELRGKIRKLVDAGLLAFA